MSNNFVVIFATISAVSHVFSIEARNTQANQYYLYTRSYPSQPRLVLVDEASIENSDIDGGKLTAILVHGHEGSAFTSLNRIVRDALLNAQDLNLIVLDWSIYSSLNYSVAVSTVSDVATELAEFITLAVNTASGKIKLNNLHLVGFDLGAHVVGITGRSLQARGSGTVARITGLDPSASQWDANSQRLRIRDASYVEVIHTDGIGISAKGLGTAIGNIDFFANGGGSQPGCFNHVCNHERAFELFAASMVNPTLIGRPCATNLQLTLNLCSGPGVKLGGNELTKIGGGIYRVNTGGTYPF